MTLIVDPDLLQQGAITSPSDAVWGSPTAAQVTITSVGSELPALDAAMYFEVRDHPIAANNGLYLEDGGSPTLASVTASKVDGVNPLVDAGARNIRTFGTNASAAAEKVTHWDTNARKLWLLRQGTVISKDGVDGQAVFSRAKIDWKDDNDLNKHPFPFFSIDAAVAGKYLMGTDGVNSNGWAYEDTSVNSRELVRNAGWSEENGDGYLGVSADGTIERVYAGIGTLGVFEDETADKAYYSFGNDPTVDSTAEMVQTGSVNEVIKCYDNVVGADTGTGVAITGSNTLTRNDGGNFLTDGFVVGGLFFIDNANIGGNDGTWGPILTLSTTVITISGTPLSNDAADQTMTIAFDNRTAFSIFNRIRDADPTGKIYTKSDLAASNLTTLGGFVSKFALSSTSDIKITETDANIDANTPFTEVRIRYLDAAYNREIDTGVKRNFGIIIDVGTYSHSNGVSATSTLFVSANFVLGVGEALADYNGGQLIIHEGTDQGSHLITGTPVDNSGTLEVTLNSALTDSETVLSFTMDRSTPLTATSKQIYEKIQRQARLSGDINETGSGVVIGKTSDVLAFFDGDTLRYGNTPPVNPEGGGAGVMVEGFDANDTNSISVKDNGATQREFPFVSAGNNVFSQAGVDDLADNYKLYFAYTEQFTNTGFGISAVTLDQATLDSSVTDLVAELSDGDYIRLAGFVAGVDNGIYVLTGAPSGAGPWTATVRKVNGQTLVNESAGASVDLDKNPIDSPDAIIVDDNAGADIAGAIGALQIAWTFDYDGNVQGGRTAATDASVILRAIGSDQAQFAESAASTIVRAVGQTITALSAQERNYNNP